MAVLAGVAAALVVRPGRVLLWRPRGSPRAAVGGASRADEPERLLELEHAARAEAESTARRIRGVLEVTETALSHLALPDLLRDVTRGVQSVLEVDVVSVVLLTPDGEELQVQAALGAEEAVAQGLRFPANQGLAGRTLAERRAVVADDVAQVELASPILRDRGVRSVLAVPLRADGRATGVLHVGTLTPRRFSESEASLLQLIADRVAVAIDRARLYEEERRAREEAQRAVLAREELLALVSHDLRNALNTILLCAWAVQRGLGAGADAPARLEPITRSAEQMRRLIQDLLDSAKIEAEGLSVERRRSDAAAILWDAERAARPLCEEKGLRLEARAAAGLPPALCDRERVLQVLSNLLGNAVKFTPPGGSVSLSAAGEGPWVVFGVADTGPGMPEEMVARIFERRWRADRTSRESSGLGLYIAKGIVEAHGGRIWVESRVGAGSLFRFTLAADVGARA